MEHFAAKPRALWILFGLGAVLFTWQQITEYLALEINFLPFSFYDYMLYYYFHGKIHYTGLLHTYYHVNNILFLLAPLWKIFQSPLLLILIYGPLAALAVFPLYAIAKERFKEALPALFTAFLYLNYRYLQNVLQMNFSVEIFYPLFIFWALAAALKSQWGFYYLALILGLSVKEDSFLYFSAIGLLVMLLPKKETGGAARIHGAVTLLLSGLYYLFITRLFMPWTGNTLLSQDFNNFQGHGVSEGEIIKNLMKEPGRILFIFFGAREKLRTYLNLFSRLLFLPFFSPSAVLILAPIFPLFMHQTGRDTDFIDLRFHYAAAVIPFVFIAFTFGFSNLLSKLKGKKREGLLWGLMILLLLLNGGNYRTEKVTAQTLKSIHWARNIPQGKNLVTHGHLLPYVGYRDYNYYFATPFELSYHPAHQAYTNADYYLIDKVVNPYPMDKNFVETKIQSLKENPRYELVLEDSVRFLFRRKSDHA